MHTIMNTKRPTDADLIVKIKSGDISGYSKLAKRWHKRFCEKAYWIIKDADVAKDVAQDSWKTIIAKIDSLKNNNQFGSWALRIVTNKAFDELRKQKRIKTISNTELHQIADVKNEDNERLQSQILILREIKNLSVEHQQILKLFYVEAYSMKDISIMLNIPQGTVKSRLFHSREKLKTILKNKHNEN